jgi:hypothetical protein
MSFAADKAQAAVKHHVMARLHLGGAIGSTDTPGVCLLLLLLLLLQVSSAC